MTGRCPNCDQETLLHLGNNKYECQNENCQYSEQR